jgi:hypothetical protein
MTDNEKVLRAIHSNDKDFMCALAIGQHGENAQRLMITAMIEILSHLIETGTIAPVDAPKQPKEWKH